MRNPFLDDIPEAFINHESIYSEESKQKFVNDSTRFDDNFKESRIVITEKIRANVKKEDVILQAHHEPVNEIRND